MKLEYECQYCGYKWVDQIYQTFVTYEPKCFKCSDKNVKAKELDDTKRDCFGYNSDSPKLDAWIKKEK